MAGSKVLQATQDLINNLFLFQYYDMHIYTVKAHDGCGYWSLLAYM